MFRSTNVLLLILNLSLFVIQYFVFMTWIPKKVEVGDVYRVKKTLADDEVIVYNGKLIQEDIKEATVKKIEPKLETTEASSWNWNWDGRSDRRPKVHRFLYLVRHGQYYGKGPLEKHLSPLGKQQAQKTGEKLRSLNVTISRFIASTSIRATETADIVHRVLGGYPGVVGYPGIEYSDGLREGWPSYPDPASPGVWDRDDPVFSLDAPRIKAAFEKFIHRANLNQQTDTNEIIVAHGNIIAYIVLRSLQLPVDRWLKVAVFQGSVALLQYHPNGDVTLRFVGDVGHLTKAEWTG